jgi:hypothetical protein
MRWHRLIDAVRVAIVTSVLLGLVAIFIGGAFLNALDDTLGPVLADRIFGTLCLAAVLIGVLRGLRRWRRSKSFWQEPATDCSAPSDENPQ